jgi:thioredoxin-like negative regulator of GroEL
MRVAITTSSALCWVVLSCVLALSHAFYEGNVAIATLTDSDFEDTVMKSDQPWIVEFYAPW